VDTDILLLPLADIVTTITDNSATYRAGDPRIYTITITNNGPSDAENVVVQGNVSSGVPLSNISWSGSGGGFTMGYLNDVIPTLANGASVTYIVYVEVPSGYSQTENLIANVSVTSDATDPNPGCTNCIDIDTPNPNADIVVYKTNNQTQFLLNEPTVYTITVRNDGASDAVNVVVNDAVPPGIPAEKMSWVSSIGTSGIGAISDLIPNLANGEIVIYKVTVQVPQFMSSITGNLINTVNVTSGTSEFNINNNNSTDVDTPRSDFVTVDSQSYSTTIDGVSGPERLIKNILINEPCVQLSNFSASAPISFGYFHRNNSVFPFKEGIIIRSGIAKNTEGKYTGVGTTSVGSNTSDADLQVIMNANGLTSQNRDASFVKFSFVPTVEDFSFNFLFASEEYGTYQCSTSFVDTFAFILTNTVTGVSQNLAVVPGTTPPTLISVVKIKKAIFNAGCGDLNPQYFGRYNAANIGPAPVGPASSAINLKGQTVSMVASANVIPNTLYSIKLVIGDAGDTALDSAVFLEAGSFNIGGPKITGSGIYASNEDFSGSSAFCAGTPRIIRAGTAPNPNVVYSWRKDDVLLVGETSYELEVSESGIYTVVFTYPNPDPNAVACQQTDDIVVEFKPTDFPMDEANDLYACNDATPTFNLTVNEPIVMANYDQFDFDTYYFTSLEAAQDPLGVPIPSSQLTTYAGADGQQIWMKMVNIFSGGNCDPVETFKLYLTTAPSGTLSYAEDGGEPGFCSGSSSILPPVAPDLTVGGTYSALPAGLTINPNTGAIDLSTSLVGTYTVTYEFSGQGCDPFTTTTQVEVIFCGATVASNSGNVCEGAATFDLFATDAGTGSTYEWSDYNGVPFSTDQNPVGIAVPTTAGAYIYTVVATINGVPTPPSSTTLTVHPIPTATFSAVSPICTNTPGTITFTGTPGAIVNFTDGTTNYSTTIDGTGNGEFTTPNLPVDTTFTLVDVTGDTVPACTGTLSGSLIIEVGLPEATIIGFTNSESVICSGTGTGLEIQGTPNSIVSYTKGGVAQPDVTLSSAGTATIDTGIQTVTSTTTYTYALTNVVSDSTPPCSVAITGETATLTFNALPTVTFTAAGASVCEGTTGTLNFIGTPNATITYNDGIQDLTTILDNTGVSAVTTAAISAATTYTLVSAEVTNTVLCSNTLTGTVTITIDENPVITTQPVGTSSCINGTVTFSVVATGANLTYQWFKGLSAITSATNASYTIASVTAASAGDYTVVVTGSCGTPVTSSIATLTVTQETLITAQPQPSTTVCVGQPINLSVTATGVNLTYQWFQGTVSLSGETNPTLNIASATTADAGTYTVVITNSCQVVTSANAVVIVNELPVIVTQPIGTTICEGQGISLSVTATGTGLTYQWFRNGTTNPIAGATAATYTDASVTLAEAGNYTVSVSGVCTPAVTSSIAVINVNQTATFTQQPVANTTVCVGGAVTFTVATTGGTGVSYQWFKGTTPIPGAIATTYTIASSVVADAGNYTCVVTVASCGTITSNVANVVVNELPAITTQPIGTTICEGQGISLSVTATGTGLTYQWFRNGTIAITGATSATYADASVSLAEAGNYTVRVSGACTPAVTSSIAVINVNQTATFTQQPVANTIVCVGSAITLTVATTGGTGVSYQWFKGTNPITGATSTTYTIASSVVADAGNYTCVVTVASCGTITSNVANVVVNELPAITTQPIGTTICEGEGISLSVTATGTGLTYQWFRNGTIAITGATSATYADASVSLAEAGNYTVRVSGACTPAVTSSIAVINVNQTATFTQQPAANTTVCSGETVTLTVATTGGTGVSCQWFKGSTAIAGATSTTYTIASSVVADSGSYTCVVTVASCGTKTSNTAVVVVNQAPAITTQPQGKVICVGEIATFTVAATGTNLTYQWYKGTTIIPSATSNTYTITNTVVADSGNYYCTIKSASCPDINSTVVNLLVKPLPVATISQGTPSTICEGQSTQVIFNGTAGAVVVYTINGGTPETITLNANVPTILPTGILDETTVYELVSVTYTGANACSQNLTGSATVTVNPLPTVTLEDGFICVDPVTLATTRTYRLDTELNDAEFTFEWFDQNGPITSQTYSYYDVSEVGQYGVTITNIITGCQSSAFANVDQSSPPTDFDYTVNGFFANNPTVVITASPIGDYEYQLDFGPFQESNVFDNITAGTHTITVRDPQACDVLTKEVFIVDYPKYFTPNGDGVNDTWNIPSIDGLSITKINIFDRFGKLVKQISASGSGWDGTYNGQPLPATDYWFTINYQEDTLNKDFKAHFSLKR
jgi:gliding motility-associated-like protein/uncharacterized repeat protein (TIGR01451 family)